MVADLIKDINESKIKEIMDEGGVSRDIALKFIEAELEWPLNDDKAYQWWIDNVRQDIETDSFDFIINPSKSSRPKNMHDNPAKVSATLIYESIGDTGSDEAIFEVNVVWPAGSTEAPNTRTYEMPYEVISSWSTDSSGTYFNSNIRGQYAPE